MNEKTIAIFLFDHGMPDTVRVLSMPDGIDCGSEEFSEIVEEKWKNDQIFYPKNLKEYFEQKTEKEYMIDDGTGGEFEEMNLEPAEFFSEMGQEEN